MEFIAVIIFIIIIGGFILWYLERCPHSWELIEKGDIKSRSIYYPNDEFKIIGYYEVHRCHHCKKLKKTEI